MRRPTTASGVILAAKKVLMDRHAEAVSATMARVVTQLKTIGFAAMLHNRDIAGAIQGIMQMTAEERVQIRTVANAMTALMDEFGNTNQSDLIVSTRVFVKDGKLVVEEEEGHARGGRRDDFHCPRHGDLFSLIEKSIDGRRICPHGDVWRINRSGNFEEVK